MARYSNLTPLVQDSNGKPITGAKTYFYEPGTETLKTIYSDSGLTTAQANPVISFAGGYLPEIYLDGLYKVVQNDEDDVSLWPALDPVGEVITGNFAAYDANVSYNTPDCVYATDDNYYYSLTDSNQGNEPSVSPGQWQVIPMNELVGLTATQRLSNKTMVDSNDNEILSFGEVASAVNEITVTNAATGNNPAINATGEDVGLDIEGVTLKNGIITGEISDIADGAVTVAKFAPDVGYRELLSTATASASATIDFSDLLDSTYKSYEIDFFSIVPATNSTTLLGIVETGGSTWHTGGTDYTTNISSTSASMSLSTPISLSNTAANGGASGRIVISDPSSTSVHTLVHTFVNFVSSVDGFMDGASRGNKYNATTAVTGFRFQISAGNITSGSFKLYGVK